MGIWNLVSKLLLIKSFVLGALILGLWVRSHFVADTVTVEVGGKSTSLTSVKGTIVYRAVADGLDELKITRMRRTLTQTDPDFAMAVTAGSIDVDRNLGFNFQKRVGDSAGLVMTTTFPHWFCFLLVSTKAIYWLIRRRAGTALKPREATGWCAACQMDQAYRNGQCVSCGSQVFNRAA